MRLKEKISTSKFIKTDDFQWVQKIDENTFRLIQVTECLGTYDISEGVVPVDTLDQDEIREALHPFGYRDMEQVREEYGKAANQILAECVFESEASPFLTFQTEREAMDYVNRYIELHGQDEEETK